MGMSYEELLKRAELFKENVWYFLECHMGHITEAESAVIRDKVNDLLDSLDELPLKKG